MGEETTTIASASHRQTRYSPAPQLTSAKALPLPPPTANLEQALQDIREYGVCQLTDVLQTAEVETLRAMLDQQAAAERALGELAPPTGQENKQGISNMVNKGAVFLDLLERPEVDPLAGMMLGKSFLLSSLTGGTYHGPTHEPQPLHRDQGQVPATVDFPAACILFWLLDDFTPERGSTWFVPGSHRWQAEHLVEAPPREMAVQNEAPAGSLVVWDGRIWHGAGANREGHSRRHIATFFCLPWMRQQENWGVSCLQEVLDEASPKLKARLGLQTYGTLGGVNGTATGDRRSGLGNAPVEFPEYIIGEAETLHPLRRVTRAIRADGQS